jgi:RNA-binding protein YlmH
LQVRANKVETTRIDIADLNVPEQRTKKITTVEPSLRIDAVASAGYGISRSKCVDMVKQGMVRINWMTCNKPKDEVKEGDLISCDGLGRVKVLAAVQTLKGKWSMQLVRYIG